MPWHIQPSGPMGATPQRADFAGSPKWAYQGTGRLSARGRSGSRRGACPPQGFRDVALVESRARQMEH